MQLVAITPDAIIALFVHTAQASISGIIHRLRQPGLEAGIKARIWLVRGEELDQAKHIAVEAIAPGGGTATITMVAGRCRPLLLPT